MCSLNLLSRVVKQASIRTSRYSSEDRAKS